MKRIILYTLVVMLGGAFGCEKSRDGETTPPEASTAADKQHHATEADEERAPTPQVDTVSRCEQAYEDLEALVAGLEEQLGSSDSELPDRDSFLTSCASLPVEIQECMVFEYAMANQKDCEARVDALDPDQREKAQELMGE